VFIEELCDCDGKLIKLYRLIDFDAAFGTGYWDESCRGLPELNSPQIIPPYLRELVDRETRQPELKMLISLTEAEIKGCFDGIPSDWITSSELESVIAWAIERARILGSAGRITERAIEVS
jgi:hypothetical protein